MGEDDQKKNYIYIYIYFLIKKFIWSFFLYNFLKNNNYFCHLKILLLFFILYCRKKKNQQTELIRAPKPTNVNEKFKSM